MKWNSKRNLFDIGNFQNSQLHVTMWLNVVNKDFTVLICADDWDGYETQYQILNLCFRF